MIDWNKRNGGFLSPESVYEDQLGNLSMQINNLQQQLDKYKNVIDKIKEYINHYETIRGYYEYEEDGYDEYNYDEDLKKDILELLEEIDV